MTERLVTDIELDTERLMPTKRAYNQMLKNDQSSSPTYLKNSKLKLKRRYKEYDFLGRDIQPAQKVVKHKKSYLGNKKLSNAIDSGTLRGFLSRQKFDNAGS